MKYSHVVSLLSTVCALGGLTPCHSAALRGPANEESQSRILLESPEQLPSNNGERNDLDAGFETAHEVSAFLVSGVDHEDPEGHRTLQALSSDEQLLLSYVQQIRRSNGLTSFQTSSDVVKEAQRWAKYMASTSTVKSRDPLTINIDAGWRAIAENDASAADLKSWVQTSTSLRSNILTASLNRIGLGVVKKASGGYYICIIFKQV